MQRGRGIHRGIWISSNSLLLEISGAQSHSVRSELTQEQKVDLSLVPGTKPPAAFPSPEQKAAVSAVPQVCPTSLSNIQPAKPQLSLTFSVVYIKIAGEAL